MGADLDLNGHHILNIAAPTSNNDLVRKIDITSLLQGPTGPAGAPGSVWWVGSGVPSNGTGVNGDLYLRSSNGEVYLKVTGSWVDQGFSIQGPAGSGSGDMLRSNNLSDLLSASTARTNLGLAIGTNVQAYNASLAALGGLTGASNKIPYFTGLNTMGVLQTSAFGQTLMNETSAATALADIGALSSTDPSLYGVTVTNKTANYTFALTDRGQLTRHNSGSAHSFTVPPHSSVAWPTGTILLGRNSATGGNVTVTRGSGVTIYKNGATTSSDVVASAGASFTLLCEDTDTWVCTGTNLS